MNTPHSSERYRCMDCRKNYTRFDVDTNWKCPSCGQPVSVKFVGKDDEYTGYRLQPSELEIGEIVLMDRTHNHQILDIVPMANGSFNVALKEYKVHNFKNSDWVDVIDGSWVDYSF